MSDFESSESTSFTTPAGEFVYILYISLQSKKSVGHSLFKKHINGQLQLC